jgi:hypothetical protein
VKKRDGIEEAEKIERKNEIAVAVVHAEVETGIAQKKRRAITLDLIPILLLHHLFLLPHQQFLPHHPLLLLPLLRYVISNGQD